MRLALITLYNHYAYSTRCLGAAAERAGHEVLLLKFKRFQVRHYARENPEPLAELAARGYHTVVEVRPSDNVLCPFPTPITADENDLFYAELERFQPEVIGLSLTSTHLPLAARLSQELRRRLPRARQIWGGIHPTMDPVGCLEYADAACVGEGEDALLEYLADPTRNDIANLQFKDPAGAIVHNAPRPLIQDLDTLAFPIYDRCEVLIDDGRRYGIEDLSEEERIEQIVVASSRGCPFACSYCMHGVTHQLYKGQKYVRRKSVDRTLREIEALASRHRLYGVTFWDDVFVIGEPWIEEFSDKYPGRVGIPFGGYAYPRISNRRMLEQLKRAGCSFITVGVQTGSDRINKIYNRSLTNEHFIELGRALAETGHTGLCYELMTRCGWETEDDLRATALLLAQMPKPIRVALKHITLFPFTPITTYDGAPRTSIPDEVHLFYEMLYLMPMMPGFDPALLGELVNDGYLRDHPHLMEQWARQLERAAGDIAFLEERVQELEGKMPWGVRRAGEHFATQVKDWVKRKVK